MVKRKILIFILLDIIIKNGFIKINIIKLFSSYIAILWGLFIKKNYLELWYIFIFFYIMMKLFFDKLSK